MSDASQFFGGSGILPAGLINGGGALPLLYLPTFGGLQNLNGAKAAAVGAVTAGVLKTVLSLAGKGAISFLGAQPTDNTGRTHRIKVTLDGVVVFDGTTFVANSLLYVMAVVGGFVPIDGTYSAIVPEPLIFRKSLLVEYASSLTETAPANLYYRYVGT